MQRNVLGVAMTRPQPGWLVAGCAFGLAISSWLPWLTTQADGGGRASAIGGTLGSLTLPPRFGVGQLIVLLSSVLIVLGAMVARRLSPRSAAAGAVAVSMTLGALTWWYFHANVTPVVEVGYGLYIGAGCAVGALACSVWALVSTMRR